MKMYAMRYRESKKWVTFTHFTNNVMIFCSKEMCANYFCPGKGPDEIYTCYEIVEVTIAEVFPE